MQESLGPPGFSI